MKTILYLFVLIIIISCKSTTDTNTDKMQDFSNEGFTKVEYTKSTTCQFILTTANGEIFETENIHEDVLKSKIKTFWIKYHALRRMSKCENTMPIQITEYRKNE